jgi:hypothetical protein
MIVILIVPSTLFSLLLVIRPDRTTNLFDTIIIVWVTLQVVT